MDKVCETCKYWSDYGQFGGTCSKISEKVVSDSPEHSIFYTDYDFSCNLYVEDYFNKNIFVKCIKDNDIYVKDTVYLITMSYDYFKRNTDLHEYFEFHGYEL